MHGHSIAGNLDLAGFLVLGLLGSSSHCLTMCAPFVLFVSDRYASPRGGRSLASAHGWYAAGRVATYVLLGAAAGALGGMFELAGSLVGLQRAAAALAGALLVLTALRALLGWRMSLEPHAGGFSRLLFRWGARVPGHPLAVGGLLGLLPCGLLYTAVVAAVARGDAVNGAMALLMFALGTVPALFGAAFASAWLMRRNPAMLRLAHAFVLVMGCWYLWRGLAA